MPKIQPTQNPTTSNNLVSFFQSLTKKKTKLNSRDFAHTGIKKRQYESKLASRKTVTNKKERKSSFKSTFDPKNIVFNFIKILLTPFVFVFSKIYEFIINFLSNPSTVISFSFSIVFLAIIFRLAGLQVDGFEAMVFKNKAEQNNNDIYISNEIIPSKRGNIYVKNLSLNKIDIPVTSTQLIFDLAVDPTSLKNLVDGKKVTLEDITFQLSSSLNFHYQNTLAFLTNQTGSVTDTNKPRNIRFPKNIVGQVTDEKQEILDHLFTSKETRQFQFATWLITGTKEVRSYPEGGLLASTIGYVLNYEADKNIALQRGECADMVTKNEERNTARNVFTVGDRGLERKYCALLAGLNGRRIFNKELIDPEIVKSSQVENGADIYLTIDRNIQAQAESILEKAVRDNIGPNGAASNGSVIVMEVKTGKVLGMASYPSFDPNKYPEYASKNPQAFLNASTGIYYEVGSVLKPITVAAALDVYQSGVTDVINGKEVRRGVSPTFTFRDWDRKGKPYPELDGNIKYISNSQSESYRAYGDIDLTQIIRDSVNTGMSELTDRTGNRHIKEYFEERFELGKPTNINMPGDTVPSNPVGAQNGNLLNLQKDIGSGYTYATFGFGQGLTMSPIQLARSYTAIANGGYLVEPYIVEKVKFGDNRIDDGTGEDSVIKRDAPKKIIQTGVANLVTNYMVAMVDQGHLGQKPSKAKVEGYSIAGKTGTAEVSRGATHAQNRAKGIYDQTFIGFGPASNPQYLVLVKLSEPNRGKVNNFADASVGPAFSNMMKYTLEYMQVKRDR